jgi:hypothetical protein
MGIVEGLAGIMSPWQSIYSDSLALSTTVTTVHIVSLLLSGGLAIAADRATLRALHKPVEERVLPLAELGSVHRPVLITLTVLMVSGVLLFAADVETFAVSGIFWVKMGLIAVLLANGAGLYRTEKRLESDAVEEDPELSEKLWSRLGRRARASLGLWLLVAVLGTVLTNVG